VDEEEFGVEEAVVVAGLAVGALLAGEDQVAGLVAARVGLPDLVVEAVVVVFVEGLVGADPLEELREVYAEWTERYRP
jgi:hypothetical protein